MEAEPKAAPAEELEPTATSAAQEWGTVPAVTSAGDQEPAGDLVPAPREADAVEEEQAPATAPAPAPAPPVPAPAPDTPLFPAAAPARAVPTSPAPACAPVFTPDPDPPMILPLPLPLFLPQTQILPQLLPLAPACDSVLVSGPASALDPALATTADPVLLLSPVPVPALASLPAPVPAPIPTPIPTPSPVGLPEPHSGLTALQGEIPVQLPLVLAPDLDALPECVVPSPYVLSLWYILTVTVAFHVLYAVYHLF
ncbi:uncharacterized protein LOC131827553 [Mustela lutreola]|uniref:uncharacterized protein LOC131827553 n=1 Tax=Mustela lutreola TaxID=9666 RepID=UPI00279704FC|nr:uncharacterized protein LOC131827553 [Mustela lutreola]